MSEMHYVRYSGIFGFIKPWTAVRDGVTYSQQFLTPSTVEGMRLRLGVSAILRHRLRADGMVPQQEVVQSAGIRYRRNGPPERPRGILTRGVLLRPELTIVVPTAEDAARAAGQHICLCRKEDVLMPVASGPTTAENLEQLPGFELLFAERASEDAFLVGYNRYADGAPMYGSLRVYGEPTRVARAGA
jgi:hypothetical protein